MCNFLHPHYYAKDSWSATTNIEEGQLLIFVLVNNAGRRAIIRPQVGVQRIILIRHVELA